MSSLFFTTGQVARELNTSQDLIRNLCAAGAIPSQTTPGGQIRIAKEVVEGLKRNGLPSMPRPLPGDNQRLSPARSRHGHAALLAEPSEQVIEAAEEVVVLENEVKALGLRRHKEEALDWFRQREEQEAERLAAEEQAKQEREAREQAQRRRQNWESRWLEYALNSVPYEARGEVETELHEQVRVALSHVPLSESGTVVQRIVDAVTTKVLRPCRRHKEIQKAIEEARDTLPYQMKGFSWSPTESEVRAREAAAKAVGELRPDATYGEMVTTAIGAVRPIIAEFEHQQQCKAILSDLGRCLSGATAPELKLAEEAVSLGLGELPVGTPRRLLEQLRDRVLQPLQEIIAKRQAEEQAQQRRQQDQAVRLAVLGWVSWQLPWDFPAEQKQPALKAVSTALDKLREGAARGELEKARDEALRPLLAAHSQRQKKAAVIESGLREIFSYLLKLEHDWDFEGKTA